MAAVAAAAAAAAVGSMLDVEKPDVIWPRSQPVQRSDFSTSSMDPTAAAVAAAATAAIQALSETSEWGGGGFRDIRSRRGKHTEE